MQQPKFLNELKKGRYGHGINVRVVRKWTHYETMGQCAPLFVGMVLADARGHAMYAEISNDLIDEKAHLFDVGKVYTISKIIVDNAKRSFKAIDKDLMIDIAGRTTADVVANPEGSFPEYIYKIAQFHTIKTARMVYNLTDVVGYLVKYEAAYTFVPKNQEKAKTVREIYLKDLRDDMMKITLWGDQALNFNITNIYNRDTGNLIVCLVVGCMPREDLMNKGKTALNGSSACCYYFNLNIPEARPFHSRFRNTPVYIEEPSEEMVHAPAEDIQLPEKTIAALNDVDPFDFDKPGPFKCAVTVMSITNPSKWWYMSCKPCKKSAEQQANGSYRCPKCRGTETIPRYILSFIGRDKTGEAKFFAYDDEAYKMIQKDCESVINPLAPRDVLPKPLQDMIKKSFVLAVDLTKESCKATKTSLKEYQVKAVLERPSKHASMQAIQEIEADEGSPTTESILLASPQKETEILQIEAATQHTPAPWLQIDYSTSKDDKTRPPTDESVTRRNLFGCANSAQKETPINTSASQHSQEPKTTPEENPSSSKPKRKRGTTLPEQQDSDEESPK